MILEGDIYVGDQTERRSDGWYVAYALYLRAGTRWWHPRYRVIMWGGYMQPTKEGALERLREHRLRAHERADEAVGPAAEFHPA